MSALAKVFVVLNLVLSLLFFGTSATLFLTRADLHSLNVREKALFDKARTDLKEAVDKQKEALVLADKTVQALRASERQLSTQSKKFEEQVVAQTARADKAESARDAAVEMSTATRNQLTKNEERIQNLETQLNEAVEKRDTALASADAANKASTRMKTDLDQVSGQLQQQKVAHADLVQKFEELELRYEALVGIAGEDRVIPAPGAPPLDAVVEAVDPDLGAVVLSVGRDQDVKKGHQFTIYRGQQFVGKVQVTRIYRDLSGAKVLFEKEGLNIRVGDKATTRLNTFSS